MDESSVSLEMERRSYRTSNDHFLKKKKKHTHTYIAMNTIPEEDEIRRNHIHGNTL